MEIKNIIGNGFTWTVPHCCNINLKFIYQKPISNIIDSNKN